MNIWTDPNCHFCYSLLCNIPSAFPSYNHLQSTCLSSSPSHIHWFSWSHSDACWTWVPQVSCVAHLTTVAYTCFQAEGLARLKSSQKAEWRGKVTGYGIPRTLLYLGEISGSERVWKAILLALQGIGKGEEECQPRRSYYVLRLPRAKQGKAVPVNHQKGYY